MASGKAWPNYRIGLWIPFIFETGVYVTNKRIMLVSHNFRLLTQELSLWFKDNTEKRRNSDFIQGIHLGKSWIWGPYLEVKFENSSKLWYRSSNAWIRLYTKKPEIIHTAITQIMNNC